MTPDVLPLAMFRRRYVLTQGNAGPTDILLRLAVNKGSLAFVDHLAAGPDDYAVGGRTLEVEVTDANGNVVASFADLAALDNQRVHIAPSFVIGALAGDGPMRASGGPWVIYGPDRIDIRILAAAQNETLTVNVRARVSGTITASSPNAGVALAETE